jgi:hypothetical protein
MTNWQPDWTQLDSVAAAFLQSTPLAAQIASVTPPGSYVATGLRLDLGQVVASAPAGGAMLVVAADTVTIPAGTLTLAAPGVQIVARAVEVAGGGEATLALQNPQAALQLATAGIAGALSVSLGGAAPVALDLQGSALPQVLTISAPAPAAVSTAGDAASVADVMHSPWCVLSLQVTSAIAGVVADQGGPGPLALAEAMLRWVTAGSQALLANQDSYADVDYADLASMLAEATSLLAFTQAAASGAVYVPALSQDVYAAEVNGALALAQIYDARISALRAGQDLDAELASFAGTLSSISQQAVTPLLATLQGLAHETTLLETQLKNSVVQLQQASATLPALQDALQQAVDDEFQKELVTTAVETLFTLATLYVGVGAALVGDPEVLAGKSQAVMKAAFEISQKLLETAREPLGSAVKGGAEAAGQPPTQQQLGQSLQGAQVLAASSASFGTALHTLWDAVGTALANAPAQIDYSPDFLTALAAMPDLSGFSTGGVDPVTYWKLVVAQTQASVRPHETLPAASAYLDAVTGASIYGSAIGDLQMKLLDLYTQGVSAFARLQAVYQAQARWNALRQALSTREEQAAAAIGLLQRGYLDVKRSLVASVANYRAAFQYQWLQHSDVAVDVSMDYSQLALQVNRSISDLARVLAGTDSGPLRPRQDFSGVTYTVTANGTPLFIEIGGKARAQWSISAGDPALTAQLGGNTALYLTHATFVLEGGDQSEEVEMEVATSGRYETELGSTGFRFVSQPVSMYNLYRPQTPPAFISSWSFDDPDAYMMPTPCTGWTLTMLQGNWQQATSITMTLAGKFLPNPANTVAA